MTTSYSADEPLKLNEDQQKLLRMIASGRGRLDYLIDGLGYDAAKIADLIEPLEKARYVARRSPRWAQFYDFVLLPAGEKALPVKSSAEEKLWQDHITIDDLKIFAALDSLGSAVIEEIAEATGFEEPPVLSALSFHCNETHYLQDEGLFRRRLRLSKAGAEVLEKHRESTELI